MAASKRAGRWESAMGETFDCREIAQMTARRTGFARKDVEIVIKAAFDVIDEVFSSGNSIGIGHFKLGNQIKRLPPFYSAMFGETIPERYALKPKLFVSKTILDKFKKLSEGLEENKEWIMKKSDMTEKYYKMKGERVEEDG